MRLLFFILLAYLLYRIIRWATMPILKENKGDSDGTVDVMVQDPSCETYIPLRDAKRKVFRGKAYYFCSKECLEKFEKEIDSEGRA